MILTECAVFSAMLLAGGAAAILASALLALGGASRVARALFDFLTPPAVGAIFFLALYLSAGGVLRLYAVLAFLLGGAGARFLLKKFSPALKRLLVKASVPIKSLERGVEKLFRPVTERLEAWRRRRLENAMRRKQKREEDRFLRAEKREKKRKKQKLLAYRKILCARGRGGARRPRRGRPIRQSD